MPQNVPLLFPLILSGEEDLLPAWQSDSFLRACPEGTQGLTLAGLIQVQDRTVWCLASRVTHSLHSLYLCAYPGTILLNKYSQRHFSPWLFTLCFHDLNGTQKGRRQKDWQTSICYHLRTRGQREGSCFVFQGRHVIDVTRSICVSTE